MVLRWQTAPILIAIALTVEACATPGQSQHTNWTVREYGSAAYEVGKAEAWVCEAFRPIELSDHDTTRTRARIFEHNAVWNALCPQDMK